MYEQPKVSSATVNLTTETAIVWPASQAKVVPNWQSQLGEALAKHLTTCGFSSNLRGECQRLLGGLVGETRHAEKPFYFGECCCCTI